MTSSSLKSLAITSFRGASLPFKLNFEKGKKLTLIYGENGTGKTTLCDGLALLDDSVAGPLEDKGLESGSEKYWPTLGDTQKNIAVILETWSETYSGKVNNRKVIIETKANLPRIALLRRNQISQIVEARAGERYKAIQRFIDIDTVESVEQELTKLIKTKNDELNRSARAYLEKEEYLESLYEKDGKREGISTKQWAHEKMAMPIQQLDVQIDAVEKLRLAFRDLDTELTRYKKSIDAMVAAEAALEQAKIIEENAITQAGSEAGELLSLLETSVHYLENHPAIPQCPLCDSFENSHGLLDRVKEKLKKLKNVSESRKTMESCRKKIEKFKENHADLLENYRSVRSKFITIQEGYAWPESVRLPLMQSPEDMAVLEGWLSEYANLPSEWKIREGSWQSEKGVIVNVTNAVHEFRKHWKVHKKNEAEIPLVEKAHAIMKEERQRFTDGIIQGIAEEVGKIYESVHPNEGLNKINLQLNPKRRASLDLCSEFYGAKAPPQAYFSQSHLETLGLCIFLALAKRDTPHETILVLDDVVGSMDEPHVDRLIGMLYEESKQFQHCIMTTHYRPWKEKYRWGLLRNGQIQFIELAHWDLSTGLRTVNTLPEVDRLKKQLTEDPSDIQTISAKAGVILEAALDYLTQKYQCRLPRRPDHDYTIGEYILAIDRKLRKALVAEIRETIRGDDHPKVTTVHLGEILDRISSIFQVRNAIGAHFKEVRFWLTDQSAIQFAQEVVSLMEALTHPEDGWPNSDKSGSYWATCNDSRRLHPLKQPG
ncbi:MAG: hypothetical protein HQL77_07260 [Magnetococcales bacterium]|nr:hypothetical protein [Magnetococcales bacterium]